MCLSTQHCATARAVLPNQGQVPSTQQMLTGDINNAQWEKLNLWGGGIRSLPGEKEEGKEQYNHSLEGP